MALRGEAISTDNEYVQPDLPDRPAREEVEDDPDYRRGDRREFDLDRRNNQDREHLRVLSICFYVYGALLALGSLFPLIEVFIGALMVGGVMNDARGGPPAFLGWFVIGFFGAASLFIWALAGCVFYTGYNLSQRKRYLFCFIVACFCCMQIGPVPLGIILGIFTIIVLVRPSVKQLFASGSAQPRPTPEE